MCYLLNIFVSASRPRESSHSSSSNNKNRSDSSSSNNKNRSDSSSRRQHHSGSTGGKDSAKSPQHSAAAGPEGEAATEAAPQEHIMNGDDVTGEKIRENGAANENEEENIRTVRVEEEGEEEEALERRLLEEMHNSEIKADMDLIDEAMAEEEDMLALDEKWPTELENGVRVIRMSTLLGRENRDTFKSRTTKEQESCETADPVEGTATGDVQEMSTQ
jgi:NADPH-dependent glutamate synthase beta subunit-like oxidoreductase